MEYSFLVLGLAFIIGFFFWRYAIQIFLGWTLIEGAFRKWLLPDSHDLMFFVGPALLAGAYVRYFGQIILKRRPIQIHHAISVILVFYFVYGFAQIFNDGLSTPLMGIVALVTHFMFVPMAYMVPDAFGSTDRFYRFMLAYVFVALPLALLAGIQLFSPIDSPINTMVASERPVLGGLSEFGLNYVRVSATFATYNGYAQFLVIIVAATLALLGQDRFARWRWPLLFVLAVSLISSLMTATRASIAVAWATLPLFLIVAVAFDRRRGRQYLFVVTAMTVLIILGIVYTRPGTAAWRSFSTRVETSGDTLDRFVQPWTPWRIWEYSGFAGNGIGVTYGGSWAVAAEKPVFPVFIHYEPERMLYELGLVGFILVYLVRFIAMGMTLRLLLRSKIWEQRLLLLVVLVVQLPVLYLGQMTYQHTYSRWWWLMLGVVFLVEREQNSSRLVEATEKSASLGRRSLRVSRAQPRMLQEGHSDTSS